jgi:hypothetical protein
MNIDNLQSLISLFLGVAGFTTGSVMWWKGSIEKRYAAERDFSHLRRNQEQISNSLGLIDKELDERFHNLNMELVQIKSLLMAILAKSGDSVSSILKD